MSNINDFVIENGVLKEYTGSDKDVSIPNEVIEIDTWAFKKCEHLINVHIPSSVETIDPQAFYYCTNLSEIHLADGVKCIQANAFDGCNSLMHLNIPSSVISMGGRPGAYFDHADPFSSCLGLQSINVSNDNPVYCSDNCIQRT